MKTDLKVHTMEIPKETIARFFAKAEMDFVRIELLEVIGMDLLRVDLVYKKDRRQEVMHLIELVDDYLLEQEDKNYKEE